MPTLHNFQERLEYSLQASDEVFWDEVYRKAFHDLERHELVSDREQQMLGIDRLLYLKCGRMLRVDEKKRQRVYPDILLEYVSNTKTQAPGWMDKPLVIDYLAYAFMPNKRVYLFDWLMLRRAWSHYADSWKQQYRTVPANNPGYTTLSLAVPIEVVQRAVTTASIIQLPQQAREKRGAA